MPVRSGKRLDWLDAAKWGSMAIVLVSHTIGFNYWRWNGFLAYIDVFTLPVFWIAAGFTSRPDFSLKKRFRSLMLPYGVITAICLIYSLIFHTEKVTTDAIIGIFFARFQLTPVMPEPHRYMMEICNSVLWFLPSMFTGYVLLKFIFRFGRLISQAIVTLCMFAVTFLFPYLPVLLPWSIDTAFFIAPLMWVGSLMRRYDLFSRFSWRLLLISLICYAVLLPWGGSCGFFIRSFGSYYPGCFFTAIFGSVAWYELFLAFQGRKEIRFLARLNRQVVWIYGLQILFFDMIFTFTPIINEVLWGTMLIAYESVIAMVCGFGFGELWDMGKKIASRSVRKANYGNANAIIGFEYEINLHNPGQMAPGKTLEKPSELRREMESDFREV